jgi:hypothetical protein
MDPYLLLTDLDPGGPKTDPMDPDPQHCIAQYGIVSTLLCVREGDEELLMPYFQRVEDTNQIAEGVEAGSKRRRTPQSSPPPRPQDVR